MRDIDSLADILDILFTPIDLLYKFIPRFFYPANNSKYSKEYNEIFDYNENNNIFFIFESSNLNYVLYVHIENFS